MEDSVNNLTWALKNGDLDAVIATLEKGDVNQTLIAGRKPLHLAADYGHPEVVKYLISKGANVNQRDSHGVTPLLSAIYEGHVSCVKILLEKGADKNVKGPDDKTCYEAAEDEAIRALLK